MKNVRVFYKKKDRMIFVSHLDMNRYFLRLLKLSKLPVWFTEGFNPHPYITFALPLSLGFESEYEVVDFRVTDDQLSNEFIKNSLSSVAVPGIEIIGVAEPKFKPNLIKKAEYKIQFLDDVDFGNLEAFLKTESIIIKKLTKKKVLKEVDISSMIFKFSFEESVLNLTLSAGSTDNLNPTLVLNAFEEKCDVKLPFYRISRTNLLMEDGSKFE